MTATGFGIRTVEGRGMLMVSEEAQIGKERRDTKAERQRGSYRGCKRRDSTLSEDVRRQNANQEVTGLSFTCKKLVQFKLVLHGSFLCSAFRCFLVLFLKSSPYILVQKSLGD